MASLPDRHAPEETLDHDQRQTRILLDRAVQVEQFKGFLESFGQSVFRLSVLGFAWPTTGIGDQLTCGIVDWDCDPARQHPDSAKAQAECPNAFHGQTAQTQIRMRSIKVLQTELQGRIPVRIGRSLDHSSSGALHWLSGLWRCIRSHTEPCLNQQGCITNADAFLSADKINDAASRVTISKANPAVLGDAHAELRLVVTTVNRTHPAQAVPVPMQPLLQTVPVQDLYHGHRPFEGIEPDELLLGFHEAPF